MTCCAAWIWLARAGRRENSGQWPVGSSFVCPLATAISSGFAARPEGRVLPERRSYFHEVGHHEVVGNSSRDWVVVRFVEPAESRAALDGQPRAAVPTLGILAAALLLYGERVAQRQGRMVRYHANDSVASCET